MDNTITLPSVDPNGFCKHFERCATSLIEEPETCDVCIFYRETGSLCCHDSVAAQSR